jgi:hypothetical protein
VSIDRAELVTDYSGNPAAIVTFTFTNRSDQTTSMLEATQADAYQNGVQCDFAPADTGTGHDLTTKVRPGASATVRVAYGVKDSSPIEVEVSKPFDTSGTLLAQATLPLA